MSTGANTLAALAGCATLGAISGAVGTFVIARRRALVADVASHATLPGACLGFLAGEALGLGGRTTWLLLLGAAATAALAAWCTPALARLRRVGADAATAVSLAGFFGAGAVLLSVAQSHPSGAQGGLARILLGSAAATTVGDLGTIAAIAGCVVVVLLLLFKELAALSFDEAHARQLGLPVRMLDLALLALLVATTVAALEMVGAVLAVALLLAPAAAARQFRGSIARTVVRAAALGAASAIGGVLVSRSEGAVPTGSAIVLCAAAIFGAAVLLRGRGAQEA